MHISAEGDPYLRTPVVQRAQHILGPFGADSTLRRWGLKLAERTGRHGKKRHHCHGTQVSGVAASFMRQQRSVRTVAEQRRVCDPDSSVSKKHPEEETKPKRPVSVTALIAWPNFHS
jgi:hypothetical protein